MIIELLSISAPYGRKHELGKALGSLVGPIEDRDEDVFGSSAAIRESVILLRAVSTENTNRMPTLSETRSCSAGHRLYAFRSHSDGGARNENDAGASSTKIAGRDCSSDCFRGGVGRACPQQGSTGFDASSNRQVGGRPMSVMAVKHAGWK